MPPFTRRAFVKSSVAPLVVSCILPRKNQAIALRPHRKDVRVLNPRERVPLAWIIDDSSCLVNLNRFAIPQFAATFPDRYRRNWRSMPHGIPDEFVRRFAEWAQHEGVRGMYSVVPFPACVNHLDSELPGWTPKEVSQSIELVQRDIAPNWEIHPEMVTHTRIIDLKTGHPVERRDAA